MNKFNYENTEVKLQNGGKLVRKVSIKNGKGHKSVYAYHKGKKIYSIKKPLHKSHVSFIKKGKFIPGLFKDCKNTRKNRRCKIKKGGYEGDIEMGKVEDFEYMKNIPPDPIRFQKYQQKLIEGSLSRPSSPIEAEKVFDKGPPEKIQQEERSQMFQEDPLNMDPFEREPLQIFPSQGGKSKKRTITKRRN
jgi:hypothetical protein